jgi:hypothetical protein
MKCESILQFSTLWLLYLYIFLKFIYYALLCNLKSRSGLESKGPCDIPYKKNPKGPQNSFKMPLFRHFVWEIVKAPAIRTHCHYYGQSAPAKILVKSDVFVQRS